MSISGQFNEAREQIAAAALQQARDQVIGAALYLSATEWGNGLQLSADSSADLDNAHERLDDALKAYVAAATTQPTNPEKAGT